MNAIANLAIWGCEACGRTVQVRLPNYYTPNRFCNCQFPVCVQMMSPISDAAKAIDAAEYAKEPR